MVVKAIYICMKCSVRKECADYKKRTRSEYGIWGGEISKRGEK